MRAHRALAVLGAFVGFDRVVGLSRPLEPREQATPLSPSGWIKTCPKCGHAVGGSLNCCGEGGEWEHTCVENQGDFLPQGVPGEHTWADGFDGCNDPAEVAKRQAEAAAKAKAEAKKEAARAAAKEKAEEKRAAQAKADLEEAQAKALADQVEAAKQAKKDAGEAAEIQEEARAAAAKEADIEAGQARIRASG